ncbi:MAG: hypothetical protein EXS63_00960 [Candidatus Omnitrophica bacterium]|nr:hypothetical protein [Candidatus Omnitrophota bacterium]
MKLLEEIKQIKSGEKELKTFGWMVGGIFMALGALMLWRGKPHFPVFFGIGVPLVLLGLLLPKSLKQIYIAWMAFGLLLGAVVAPAVLGLLYFSGITPIAMIARLTGKEFLDFKFKKPTDSYWIPKPKKDPQKSCETQY